MRYILAALFLASPAAAQEVTMDGLVITHDNQRTFGQSNEHLRFEIPEGDVVLFLERVDEACPTRPSCPDTLTVLSLPIGMRAEPVEVTTPEGMSRTIDPPLRRLLRSIP